MVAIVTHFARPPGLRASAIVLVLSSRGHGARKEDIRQKEDAGSLDLEHQNQPASGREKEDLSGEEGHQEGHGSGASWVGPQDGEEDVRQEDPQENIRQEDGEEDHGEKDIRQENAQEDRQEDGEEDNQEGDAKEGRREKNGEEAHQEDSRWSPH